MLTKEQADALGAAMGEYAHLRVKAARIWIDQCREEDPVQAYRLIKQWGRASSKVIAAGKKVRALLAAVTEPAA